MRDVWQIDMVGRTSHERTGYATQKPEELLARIIETCTKEGDICADFFSGSGTLAAVAEVLERQWLLCDSSPLANLCAERRLADMGAAFDVLNRNDWMAPKPPEMKFTIELAFRDTTDAEKKLAVLRVLSYEIPEVALPLEEKHVAQIEKTAKNNPGGLIESIGVDFDPDGPLFRPQAVAYGTNCLEMIVRLDGQPAEVAYKRDRIAVRIADVFGHTYTRTLTDDDIVVY
jgi:hypothetical protein